jgi:2-oxoacid dehydrogenases acyltransferase (catalytic domain)
MSVIVGVLEWCCCNAFTVLSKDISSIPQDVFAERHGVKLGFMSAFVKAAAAALKEVPAVNGVIDGTDIIYRCDSRACARLVLLGRDAHCLPWMDGMKPCGPKYGRPKASYNITRTLT